MVPVERARMPLRFPAGIELSSVASALAGATGWLRRSRCATEAAVPEAPSGPRPEEGGPVGESLAGDAVPDPARALRLASVLDFDGDADAAIQSAETPLLEAVRATLARIDSQPHYLPRRPLVLPQLMRSVNDPDGSARAVAAIIERDPALSAHLLRVANSAYYRTQPRPVASLERAVAMVGTDGLRRIVAAALMQPVMGGGGDVFARASATAWDHALLAGEAAAERARGATREDPFAAHLLCLLQGLGAVVVLQVLRDEYARRPASRPAAAVAASLLAGDSAAVAGRIALRWNLADPLRAMLQAETLQGGAPAWSGQGADTLAHAVHAGRVGAALLLLHRHGRVEAEAARACLARAMPAHEAARLWNRLLHARDGS